MSARVELYRSEERMTVNMGPHHPSAHGVLRLVVETDGEVVVSCRPEHGYLHRSIEKIGECVEWGQFVPYTDRVDYVCAMNSNLAWSLAVEALLEAGGQPLAVPERAEYARVLLAELNRIASHLVGLGAMAMDLGAYTPFMQAVAQREFINDVFERTSGTRLTYNHICPGGMASDLHSGAEDEVRHLLDGLDRFLRDFEKLVARNTIFRARLAGVGVVDADLARGHALAGANLRASGVSFDVRRDIPYGLYDRFQFDIPLGRGWAGSAGQTGDCYDRFWVRFLEVRESMRICRQVLLLMPPSAGRADDPTGGWLAADSARRIRRPPPAEVAFRSENPRGETLYHLVSDGGRTPRRVRIRTGSFTAMSLFSRLAPGLLIADLVALIGSFDIVVPEVDR